VATIREHAPNTAAPRPGVGRRLIAETRGLLRDALARLRGHDVALVAAGLTFYSGIAIVPSLLLAIRIAALISSPETIASLGERIAEVLPEPLGAPDAVRRLVEAGLDLTWLGALIAVFPASFYGEGLRRAFLRFVDDDDTFVGWRGRLLVLPLLVVIPVLLYLLLLVSPTLSRLSSQGGAAATVAGVVVGFFTVWLVLAVPIAWTFRVVAPGRLSWTAIIIGALATSSFVSGFLQGFVLFLAIPVDLGAPFGGLAVIGAVVAVGFWLFVLHVVVLVGYVVTRSLSARLSRGRAPDSA
jgi:membrane protein